MEIFGVFLIGCIITALVCDRFQKPMKQYEYCPKPPEETSEEAPSEKEEIKKLVEELERDEDLLKYSWLREIDKEDSSIVGNLLNKLESIENLDYRSSERCYYFTVNEIELCISYHSISKSQAVIDFIKKNYPNLNVTEVYKLTNRWSEISILRASVKENFYCPLNSEQEMRFKSIMKKIQERKYKEAQERTKQNINKFLS